MIISIHTHTHLHTVLSVIFLPLLLPRFIAFYVLFNLCHLFINLFPLFLQGENISLFVVRRIEENIYESML